MVEPTLVRPAIFSPHMRSGWIPTVTFISPKSSAQPARMFGRPWGIIIRCRNSLEFRSKDSRIIQCRKYLAFRASNLHCFPPGTEGKRWHEEVVDNPTIIDMRVLTRHDRRHDAMTGIEISGTRHFIQADLNRSEQTSTLGPKRFEKPLNTERQYHEGMAILRI